MNSKKNFFLKRNPDNGSDFNERCLMLTRNTLHLTTISRGGQWWIFTEPPGSNGSIHPQPWTLYTQRLRYYATKDDLNSFIPSMIRIFLGANPAQVARR